MGSGGRKFSSGVQGRAPERICCVCGYGGKAPPPETGSRGGASEAEQVFMIIFIKTFLAEILLIK